MEILPDGLGNDARMHEPPGEAPIRGWSEVRRWRSLDNQLRIEATWANRGHVLNAACPDDLAPVIARHALAGPLG